MKFKGSFTVQGMWKLYINFDLFTEPRVTQQSKSIICASRMTNADSQQIYTENVELSFEHQIYFSARRINPGHARVIYSHPIGS